MFCNLQIQSQRNIIMRFIIVAILSLIISTIKAQEHPIVHAKYERDIFQRFDNLTIRDGLPSNVVRQIFQDKDGFMWFATDNGLSRYDGVNFLNFFPIQGDSTSISDSKVTCITQTADGFLWVGTQNGLNRLNTLTGKFEQYTMQNSPFVRDNYIRVLLVCSDGDLWYDTWHSTLTRLNPKTFEFHHYSRNEYVFAQYYNHALFETTDKKIWCGSYGSWLHQYDKKTNTFYRYQDNNTETFRGINPIADGYDDGKDYIWIANFAWHASIINKKTGYKTPLLKHNGEYAIASDLNKNIWFGGYYEKLYKYDPEKNKVTYYEHNKNNPQSLLGGEIYTIYCDRSGVIWVGSKRGLSKLCPYKYKFPYYRHIPDFPSPKTNNITSIFEDYDKEIWFGTADSSVFCYNPINNTYRDFKSIGDNPQTIGSNNVTSIAQTPNRVLWFSLWGGKGGALNSYNKKTGKFKRYSTCDDYYWYSSLNTYQNQVLVGSWGTGVLYFDPNKSDYVKVYLQHSKGFNKVSTHDRRYVSDKYGNIWYYYYNDGIICMYSTKEDKYYTFYSNRISTQNKFSELNYEKLNSIAIPIIEGVKPAVLHKDVRGIVWEVSSSSISKLNFNEKNFESFNAPTKINPSSVCNSIFNEGFWIGKLNGVIYFSQKEKSFKIFNLDLSLGEIATIAELDKKHLLISSSSGTYLVDLNSENKLKETKSISQLTISSSCRLLDGNILLGNEKGLFIYNFKSDTLKRINDKSLDINIYSMYASEDGVYIGSNNGLLLYNSKCGIERWWKANPKDKSQLSSNIIQSVTQTPDGTIWLGTDQCLSTLNPEKQIFTNYTNTCYDAITSFLVSVIYTDSKANTWVGSTTSGLSRIDNKTGKVFTYWQHPSDTTSIAEGPIADIYESLDSIIWIGTENGLYMYRPQFDNFLRIGERNGLNCYSIRSIRDDKCGNIWIGTAIGISKFNPVTKQVLNFSWKDGLQSGEFNSKSANCLKDGKMIFGGEDGYNMFDPQSIQLNPYIPKPLVTSIKINNLLFSISNPTELSLNYDERNIEISLSVNDYNFPENNKIEYKLEGFDKEYKQIPYGVPIVYTNLSYGTYLLSVKVANNDDKQSDNPLIIKIIVEYPFWLKWWSILIEIIIISGLFSLLVLLRTKRVLKSNIRFRNEVGNKTQTLQVQKDEITSQNIALIQQKDHIQKLYNQVSEGIEFVEYFQRNYIASPDLYHDVQYEILNISVPKHQISGDYFEVFQSKYRSIFILIDFNLPGISGAFLKVIISNILREIIKTDTTINCKQIVKQLKQKVEGNEIGYNRFLMDSINISILIYDRSKMEVSFHGDNVDLYYLDTSKRVKSFDRFKNRSEYNDLIIKISHGDMLYLSSDGIIKFISSIQNESPKSLDLINILSFIEPLEFDLQKSWLSDYIYSLNETNNQMDDITLIGIKIK